MGMNKNSLLELIKTFEASTNNEENELLYYIVNKILNEDLSENDYTLLYYSSNYLLNSIAIKIMPRHLLLNIMLEENDHIRINRIKRILDFDLTASEADTLLMAKSGEIVKYAIKKASIEKIIVNSKCILSNLPCLNIREDVYNNNEYSITDLIKTRIIEDICKNKYEFTTDDANFYLNCKENSLRELAVEKASIKKVVSRLKHETDYHVIYEIISRLERENYKSSFNENIMLLEASSLDARKFAMKRLPTNILIKTLKTVSDKRDMFFIFDQLINIRKYTFSKDDINSLLHASLPLVRIEMIEFENSINNLNELLISEKDEEVIAHIKYRIYILTSKIDSKDDIIKKLLEEENHYLTNLLSYKLRYDFNTKDADMLINAKSPYVRVQYMYRASTPNLIKRLEVEEKEYLLNKIPSSDAKAIIDSILSLLQNRNYILTEEEAKLFINSSFNRVRLYAISHAPKNVLLKRLKIEKNADLIDKIITKLFNI